MVGEGRAANEPEGDGCEFGGREDFEVIWRRTLYVRTETVQTYDLPENGRSQCGYTKLGRQGGKINLATLSDADQGLFTATPGGRKEQPDGLVAGITPCVRDAALHLYG